MSFPPGPRGLQAYRFFGGGSVARAVDFLQRTAETYGPVSSFRVLNQRICLVDDAELIKQVLVTDQALYTRDNGAMMLRELVGDGLLTSDEPRHKERRRAMQPAFHRAQIGSYADAMVTETQRAMSHWKPGHSLDIGAEMKRLTLAIVGAALFGVDFGDNTARVATVLQRAIRRAARVSLLLPILEPWLVRYRRSYPKGRSLFFEGERRELEEIIRPILNQRQSERANDVLSLLLQYAGDPDNPLSEDDIRNEVVTLVLAGHETTATALTWAWYLIAKHREVEHKLQNEANSALGGRPPALEDLPNLTYAAAVFSEALRLYPPALAFGRRPVRDVGLGGYTIPARTSVILSPYITHRNPRYFDRPADFLPERWLQESQPPKFAYFPFGGGAKMCIGDGFAKMEGVLVLTAIAQKWRLTCDLEANVGVRPGITLGPDRVIPMTPVPVY
ncbi:MAG TPA: cytochrome P450 [Bryobacteraceae bacterium]|nr:cytochrome P450 [Bryobacteraceae bacterium]